MKIDLKKYMPLGVNYYTELGWIGFGFVTSFFYSFLFFSNYEDFYREYDSVAKIMEREGKILPYAEMLSFWEILGNSFFGFFALSCCMTVTILYHYMYHQLGTKSVYLMKRLPDRWDYHRRCLAIPIAVIVCCLACISLLTLWFYSYYKSNIPAFWFELYA